MMNNDDWFKEIFKEFYELFFSRDPHLSRESFQLRDFVISPTNYILLRQRQDQGASIHWLLEGSSIIIPQPWINIFSSLNIHSGDRVLRHRFMTSEEKFSGIGGLGYQMLSFIICSDRSSLSSSPGSLLLEIIQTIYAIGTKEFREWVKESFDLDLSPFEYRTLEEIIDI